MLLLRLPSLIVLAAVLGLAAPAAALPPVANAGPDQTIDCAHPLTGAQVTLDGSLSSDPELDPLSYSWADASLTEIATGVMPTLTLPVGPNVITLTVDDGTGGTATDTVTITVNADAEPPVLLLKDESDELWPPNHKLHGYQLADLVDSAVDACDGDVTEQVVFGSATSDESDDDRGDGATNDDVQFSDECQRAHVRSERSGTGDGRVYELLLHVEDAAGNDADEAFLVAVPHDRGHDADADPDPGPVTSYTSDCAEDVACAPAPDYAGCEMAGAGDFSLRTSKKGPKLEWRASGFAAGSVSASNNAVCAYVDGKPAGVSGAPEVKVKGKKGKGKLSVSARGAGIAPLPAAVASGKPLRLELHDGAGDCVAYEEETE